MKLTNHNPRNYIGRTVIYRSGAWRIDGVDSEHVLLSKSGLDAKGKLGLHLFGSCTLFPSAGEIQTRFPKLLRALRTVCNLTSGEAENALLGMITNGPFFAGSEALAHLGGSANAVRLCWRHRNRVRESFARYAKLAA
jgi:hypothetical protein